MKHRLESIDALRGIAAVLVIVQHVAELAFAPVRTPGLLAEAWTAFDQVCSLGRAGVVAFFAISGFVIPFSFRPVRPLSTFVISRFFRLYPAYWLSLLCALVVMPVFADIHFPPRQVLANLTMAHALFHQEDVIGVYWTLFIELIFYGLCFLAVLCGQRFGSKYLIVMSGLFFVAASGMAAARWLNPASAPPVAIPLGLLVMHLGTLARRAVHERDPLARRALPIGVGLFCLALPAICYLAYSKSGEQDPWLAIMTGNYLGVALFGIALGSRLLVSRATLYLGKISYSLYLFHALCMTVALYYAGRFGAAGPWLAILATFASSIAVAALVFRWVEQPAMALGRQLSSGARPAEAI